MTEHSVWENGHTLLRIVTCENQPLVEYWWWMFQQSDILFIISEAEREPEASLTNDWVLEPATWVTTELKCTVQSITESGEDHCLIDLWSMDPVPSQVFTLMSSPSTLVPSSYLDGLVPSPSLVSLVSLVSSFSSALLAPLTHQIWASWSPAWHEDEDSQASPQASRPMSPPWPVSLSAPPCLCSPSTPLCLPCPFSSGSVIRRSASVMDFWFVGCASTLHPFRFLLPSSFPVVLTPHVAAPVCRAPVSAFVPQASSSTFGFQPVDVTLVRRLLCFTGYTIHSGSDSVDQSSGSTQPCSQSSTLAPPTVGSTMVSISTDSSWSLSITISTSTSRAATLSLQMDLRCKGTSSGRGSYWALSSRSLISLIVSFLFLLWLSLVYKPWLMYSQ